MIIRKIRPGEYSFLKEMLYVALYVPDGEPPFPDSILEVPKIKQYVDKFGDHPYDLALVAEQNALLVGACWGRLFQPPEVGYGFISADIPELCMAVRKNYRRQGLASRLIGELCQQYARQKIFAVSLSVDKRNPAKKLYALQGFQVVEENADDFIMRKRL